MIKAMAIIAIVIEANMTEIGITAAGTRRATNIFATTAGRRRGLIGGTIGVVIVGGIITAILDTAPVTITLVIILAITILVITNGRHGPIRR